MNQLRSEIRNLAPWYQAFNTIAGPTTKKQWMTSEHADIVVSLIPYALAGKVVFDLGCNAGLVSFRLARLGARVIGVEKDEHYVRQAFFAMESLDEPKIAMIQGDVEKMDLSSVEPDLVVALSILYHLKDPQGMVKRLCSLNCDILASFRELCYAKYKKMFAEYGKKVTNEASYGRKEAALFV